MELDQVLALLLGLSVLQLIGWLCIALVVFSCLGVLVIGRFLAWRFHYKRMSTEVAITYFGGLFCSWVFISGGFPSSVYEAFLCFVLLPMCICAIFVDVREYRRHETAT